MKLKKYTQLDRHLYNLPLYDSFNQKEINAYAYAAFKPYLSQEYIYLIFNLGKKIREGEDNYGD